MLLAQKNSKVLKEDLKKYRKKIKYYFSDLAKAYKDNNYSMPEAALYCPYDKLIINKTEQLAKKFGFATNIILIGIGGSNLGTKTIYKYFGSNKNIVFLDTINVKKIESLKKFKLQSKNTCVIFISKSGETTESLVNAEIILKLYPKLKKNTVVISNINSPLSNFAKRNNIELLEIYPNVSGRFSVFSPVGLFPLMLLEINVINLLKGARDAITENITYTVNNKALKSAISIYVNYLNGKQINNYFLFNPNLEELGKWVRQLIAESLGKENKGILPIYTLGTVDLHSIYQLFLQGPKNVFTIFLKTEEESIFKLDNKLFYSGLVGDLKNKKLNSIYNSIYSGVIKSYKNNKLPFLELKFEKFREYEMGYFMQYKMIETMFLGVLLGINTFNQPGVEAYKIETKKILKSI